MAFLNVHRTATANFNDAGAAVSGKGKSQLTRTNAAMKNVHFRRAVCFSLDRAAYNAQSVGEELKYASLINSYTPGVFVSLVSPVTVTIGGETVTYEAGTPYGKILQDQLTADGVRVRVWDEKADGGVGASSGFDGWFSPENARKELALAVSQLAADGLPISENDPIHLEMPYFAGSEPYTNRANALKQSVEAALGGAVVVDLVACSTSDVWYDAGYQANFGYESNYDLYDVAGWGPDYGDPQTYLDTFLPDYAGYVLKRIGIF
jgi:ABC-type oligopeptide transport system substrate-binding subunit